MFSEAKPCKVLKYEIIKSNLCYKCLKKHPPESQDAKAKAIKLEREIKVNEVGRKEGERGRVI